DELVDVGGAGGRDDVLGRRVGTGVRDVLRDARREEHRLLQYDGELAAQVDQAVLPQVDAVEQNRAVRRVVEPGEQVDDRRLAGAGRSHDAEPRTGRDVEGDLAQHGTVRSEERRVGKECALL